MNGWGIKVTYPSKEHAPAGTYNRYKRASAEGMQNLLLEWGSVMGPRHFEPGAASRYGFQLRRSRYVDRKMREGYGNIPLIYKGRLRNVMRRIPKPVVKRTAGNMEGRLTYRGLPKHAFYRTALVRTKGGEMKLMQRPDIQAELVATTKGEAHSLMMDFQEFVARKLAEKM